jgi:hypothetical protein
MYRPELKVSPQGIMSSLINPSASQNIVAMTFTAEQVALNFLLQEAGRRHSKSCLFSAVQSDGSTTKAFTSLATRKNV